jgi:hypothetical protein
MALLRMMRLLIASAALLTSSGGGLLVPVLAQSATPATRTSTPDAPTATPTPSVSPHRESCVGDCDDDGVVIVGEIVTGVNIALDRAEIDACRAFACNEPNVDVFVNCGVAAVHNALAGCPTPPPTPTPAGFIRYHLVQGGSQLTRSVAHPGPIITTTFWPMSGTFDVIATDPADGEQVFHFTITNLQFAAAEHTVIGDSGEISVREGTGRVTMAANLTLDGESLPVAGELPVSVLSDSYPPDLVLQACGAPGRLVSCGMLNGGEDSGYSLTIRAVSEAVQTPLPTRTPTPTVSVVYELVAGSTILMAVPTPGSVPIVEPLSGTFVGRFDCRNPVECVQTGDPNTVFAMAITSMEFHSPHFSVAGTGYVHVLTFHPFPLVGGQLLIRGQSIGVNGGGAFDGTRFPPSFPGLEICGGASDRSVSCDAIRSGREGGYALTLFAVPQQ